MTASREVFLAAAATVPEVVTSVAAHWDRPSALEGWTVGGLTGHLTRAVTTVGTYLTAPAPEVSDLLDAPGYFASVPLDDPDMRGSVLARGAEAGSVGAERLAGLVAAEVAALARALGAVGPERRVAVLGGRSMTLDDYLVTRVVELVVHTDDVAASVSDPVPELPADAVDLAITALVDLAVRTHGRRKVVASLSRRERATSLAVF